MLLCIWFPSESGVLTLNLLKPGVVLVMVGNRALPILWKMWFIWNESRFVLQTRTQLPAAELAELNKSAGCRHAQCDGSTTFSAAGPLPLPRHASRNEGQSSGVRLKGTETPHGVSMH